MTSDMLMASSPTVETAICKSTTLNIVAVPLTESGLSSGYTTEVPGSADLPDNSGGIATVSVVDA